MDADILRFSTYCLRDGTIDKIALRRYDIILALKTTFGRAKAFDYGALSGVQQVVGAGL